LADAVHERAASAAWLDLVDREYGYLMMMTRRMAEERKAASNV
jgi:hypothetical protein